MLITLAYTMTESVLILTYIKYKANEKSSEHHNANMEQWCLQHNDFIFEITYALYPLSRAPKMFY